jgi:hypothetical protein
LFELTSLDECDIAVLPVDWMNVRGAHWLTKTNQKALERCQEFAQLVAPTGKPLVMFFSGDCSGEPVPLPGATVFRHHTYRSRRGKTDFVFPAFVEDFVHHYFAGKTPIRRKSATPTVGFCGLARPQSPSEWLKLPIYHALMLKRFGHPDVSPYKGITLRQRALRVLGASRAVKTNFVIHGETVFLTDSGTVEAKRQRRAQYVQNLEQSDYVLCLRGSGNFSFRLFETLSCGRIPIFIDTDCVLPFDSILDWRKHCIWVDESEIDELPERVAAFHDALSPDEFEELQLRCRDLWRQWLSADGFFTNFHRHFHLASAQASGVNRSRALV